MLGQFFRNFSQFIEQEAVCAAMLCVGTHSPT